MRTRRPNVQLELALGPAAKGEVRVAGGQGKEARVARRARTPGDRAGAVNGGGPPAWQLEEGAGACPAPPRGARCRRDGARRLGRSPERPLDRDQVPASRWHPRTAAGVAGGDPERIGRWAPAGRADGARTPHPAGGDACVAGGQGRKLLGRELRVPARLLLHGSRAPSICQYGGRSRGSRWFLWVPGSDPASRSQRGHRDTRRSTCPDPRRARRAPGLAGRGWMSMNRCKLQDGRVPVLNAVQVGAIR